MTPCVPATEEAWLAPLEASGEIKRKPSPPAPRAGRAAEDDPIPVGPVTFMVRVSISKLSNFKPLLGPQA